MKTKATGLKPKAPGSKAVKALTKRGTRLTKVNIE